MLGLARRVPMRPSPVKARSVSAYVCSRCLSARKFSASVRRPAALPPLPAPVGYANLASRRLISIAGVDTQKFLQGLITSDMEKLGRDGSTGFYTSILTAEGRVQYDLFIYPDTLRVGVAAEDPSVPADQAFLVEVDGAQADGLLKLIRRYRLRSKFKYRLLAEAECNAWQVWDDAAKDFQAPGGSLLLQDLRAPQMGYRVITKDGTSGLELDMEQTSEDAYHIRRYLRGVPEGQGELRHGQALPLESNIDLMGGVDFRKGCYVGQELTIRTRHRGVIRKRILPCILYGDGDPIPQSLEYTPDPPLPGASIPLGLNIGRVAKSGRSAGNWLSGVGNVGLALCRLQIMTDVEIPGETTPSTFDPAAEFKLEWGADEEGNGVEHVKIKAFVPDWLQQRVSESSPNAAH